MGEKIMADELPPLPAGFSPVQADQSLPPLPAGFSAAQPQQAQVAPEQRAPFNPMKDISLFGVTGEDIAGAGSLAKNIITGEIAKPIAGLSALKEVAKGEGIKAAETVEEVTKKIQTPLSEEGLNVAKQMGEGLSKLSEVPGIDNIIKNAKSLDEILVRAGEVTGKLILDPASFITGEETAKGRLGEAIGGSIAGALPETAAEVTALRGIPAAGAATTTLKPATQLASRIKQAAPEVKQKILDTFNYQSPTKQKIAELVAQGSEDISTAKFKLKEPEGLQKLLGYDKAKVVKDKVAMEAINQGFDEGVVAAIKPASKLDKQKMAKMVDILEAGQKNTRTGITKRPSDVAGDSLKERFDAVKAENIKSGKELDDVAKSLKAKPVDPSEAINSFLDDLDAMGITLNRNNKPNFMNSDIEGGSAAAKQAQNSIKIMLNRLTDTKAPDAYDLHRLKRFIDSQVTFGKTAAGLPGGAERVLKGLRKNIDETLDKNFPEYDKVNSTYAETVRALNAFQDVAGKKMDLSGANADKAVGTLLRRMMSNQQSRVRLLDAVNEIESVANKYTKDKFKDDLLTQILFADELDRVFGATARTSFKGQIEQALPEIPMTMTGAAVQAARAAARKLKGVNKENALKSIRELLESEKNK